MTSFPLRAWFRPGLLGLHAFAIVAVGVCVGMGLWQLGAYDSRQEAERADQGSRPVVALADVWGPDDPFERSLENRRVRVEGRFAPTDQHVWVTARDDGVWLVAPLEVSGSDASLLVVRGRTDGAGEPPAVPAGDVILDAVLRPSEGAAGPFDPADRTIGSLSIPALLNVLDGDLYSGYAIATSGVPEGLIQVTPPGPEVPWTVGLRNLAYAVQWWVFGAFALFMWWRMASENVAMRRAQAEAESVSEPPIG